jgi:hypothetical protein
VGWWDLDLNPDRSDPCPEPKTIREVPANISNEIFLARAKKIYL